MYPGSRRRATHEHHRHHRQPSRGHARHRDRRRHRDPRSGSEHAGRAARAKTTWTQEDDGEWIANYGGYFGGTVDKRDGRYVASDTFGLVVGDFATLEDAQAKLADQLHVMLPAVIRR